MFPTVDQTAMDALYLQLSLSTEPFNVDLCARLIRHPIEAQIFPEPILHLVGLASSWEEAPMKHALLVDGDGSLGPNDQKVIEVHEEGTSSKEANPEITSRCPTKAMKRKDGKLETEYSSAQSPRIGSKRLPCSKVQRRLEKLVNFHDVEALHFAIADNMMNNEAQSLPNEASKLRTEVRFERKAL
ncbi:hypothetical protein Tco_0590704 [Tanacetum coccineum]